MNKPEFKIGDVVTFKPYEKAIKGKVKSIKTEGRFTNSNTDHRIFYELSGVSEPLLTVTTGLSIVESKFYNFISSLHEEAMENITGEWMRPKQIHERPEIIRDLLEWGYLECKREVINSKTGAEICYYR